MQYGFVKLHRQSQASGIFNMPELAFKIWHYCLLKANPFPTGELNVGELHLTYSEVQKNLCNGSKTFGRSRVSAALAYLKKNHYLEITTSHAGMTIKFCNWEQSRCKTIDKYNSPETEPLQSQIGTTSSSEIKPHQSRNITTSSSDLEPLNQAEPCNGADFREPKNNLKNKTFLDNFKQQFPRHNNQQWAVIKDYWRAVIRTNKQQVVAKLINQYMNQWELFTTDVVLEALDIHLQRHQYKGADYTLGIMKPPARRYPQWKI